MALLVGLDVGTTSAKAVVFTDQGEVVGEGRARTPWITTSFGVELAAEELLNAAIEALWSAVDAVPARPTSRPLASPAWVNPVCLSIKKDSRCAGNRVAR